MMETPPLVVQRKRTDSLVLDPANARLHPEENLDAILASLKRFGQAEPLVVQAGTQRVIAGNGRLVAMRSLGWETCDVVELEVDDLTATSLGIALNRTAELATWDNDTLARLLKELRDADAIEGVGFDGDQVDALLASIGVGIDLGEFDDYPAPEPLDDAVSQPGDIWLLGDHRLMCGDSSHREDLRSLLAGHRIQLVNTDPPYNVKVEPRSNNAIAAGLSSHKGTHHQGLDLARRPGAAKATGKMRAKDRPLANDFMTSEDFDVILRAWFGNLAEAMEPGAAFYIWGGYANLANYPPALRESGLYFSQSIVWNKLHPVLTRKDFMGAFELAFYGWKEGAGHKYYGPNNATDLWEVKKVNPQSMIHLTEKPVELATRAIQYSSKRGEHVLDLFGGSGSTLMACEVTERRGFLMELDGSYCDVIIRRFEQHTGKEARHELTGKTFAELSEIREVKKEEDTDE